MRVVIDASVLVGLINPRDLWREQAISLRQALLDAGSELFYFDCVVAEAVSAAVRRLHEKGRVSEVETLMDRLDTQAAPADITWILPDVPNMYPDILALIRSSSGELNFNDALIALACRQRDIPAIASFDADFDHVPWLRRLAQSQDIQP
jgi:predicted nucleic acid-binding protein